MPLSRNDWQRILSQSTLNIISLCVLSTLASCSNEKQSESSLSDEPPKVSGKKPRSTDVDASTDDDSREEDAATRIVTKTKVVDAGAKESKPKETKKSSEPAASKDEEKSKSPSDAGNAKDKPDDSKDKPNDSASKTEEPKQEDDMECSRKWLREKAEVYLQSMSSGDTKPLKVHPSFRYTENGRDEQLGGGLWIRRADSKFARHVLDETNCSTLTQAVMDGLTGRFAFGVRLHYQDGQILDAEAQFMNELVTNTDLDKIIPKDDTDPFVAEVPKDKRATREELFDFARRYFDSVTNASSLPPSAADCHRVENGLPLGDGTCTQLPGSSRFQQQRFDVADELNGIATATVLYDSRIFFYLLKVEDGKVQNIQVVGGATSLATGW